MEGVSGAVTEAIPQRTDLAPAVPADGNPADGEPGVAPGARCQEVGAAVGAVLPRHAQRIGNPGRPIQPSVAATNESPALPPNGTGTQSTPGMGGSPMMGGGPLAPGGQERGR